MKASALTTHILDTGAGKPAQGVVVELYRLDQDPSEKTDLAKSAPDQAAALLLRLKAWYADTQRTATPQPGGWPH